MKTNGEVLNIRSIKTMVCVYEQNIFAHIKNFVKISNIKKITEYINLGIQHVY
jgi:hypothetical protein